MKLPAYLFYVFLVAAFAVILLPHVLRVVDDNLTLPGDEPYYHARIARQIIQTGMPVEDNLVLGRHYYFNPYHFVLAAFSYLFGVVSASRIVPLLAGILSFCLLYVLLKKLRVSGFMLFSILGVFILSPVFVHSFSLSTPACIMILFNLLGLYFFTKEKSWCVALSALFFGLNAFLGVIHAIVSAAIIIFYTKYNKKRVRSTYLLLALLGLILFIHDVPVALQQESVDFVQKNLVTDFIADLGGLGGFSVFMLLLGLIGLIGLWKYKKEHYMLYAAAIFLVVYSFFNKEAVVYSNFIIVFFAGVAFAGLARMRWQLVQIRNLSLIVLFCGLIFSTISQAFAISTLPPDEDAKDALLWLSFRAGNNMPVFSHYSKGFWIEFWTGQPVMMDELFSQTPDVNAFYLDSNAIFYSNDIILTRKLLSKYNVRYIFLTKDMSQGLIWEEQNQGLVFLLSNNETFKKRYANPCCEIYEYIYNKK